MIFPFYNNDKKAYTIDDANIGCNRVIVSDCDNWHKYASLCELIADCPSVKQLTKDCVIRALNDLNHITWTSSFDQSKWFLRVTSDGCLEVADPKTTWDQDKYVVVSEDDNNPWPLDTKVKWSCSYDGLYCIDIEEAWPQLLVWRPSGPSNPFINAKEPTKDECKDVDDWYWFFVRMVKDWDSWSVDYSCPEQPKTPQYCKCIYTWGQTATPWIKWDTREWRTVRYFLPHSRCTNKPYDDWTRISWADSYVNWDWNIRWTEAFKAPNSYWVVRIVQPWVYVISYSTYIRANQTLHSIRCWLYVNVNWVLTELNDIKYQCWEYPGLSTLPSGVVSEDNPPLNRMFPDSYDKNTWLHYRNTGWTLDNTGLPFSRTYILDVTTETEIYMAVKPDMRDEDPRLIKANDKEVRYNLFVTWTSDSDEYWASTTIEITRVSDAVIDSRLKEISL